MKKLFVLLRIAYCESHRWFSGRMQNPERFRQGGAVDDVVESVTHGRARKSARANDDALSLNAYRQKAVNKKA